MLESERCNVSVANLPSTSRVQEWKEWYLDYDELKRLLKKRKKEVKRRGERAAWAASSSLSSPPRTLTPLSSPLLAGAFVGVVKSGGEKAGLQVVGRGRLTKCRVEQSRVE